MYTLMFIDTSTITGKSGKTYTRVLLRMAYRDNQGAVKHRTLGNLSGCSQKELDAIRFALKNKDRLPDILAGGVNHDYFSRQGLSVGSVYVVYEIARRLGIMDALGKNRSAKLALWQIIARVIDQGSRLSAVRLATNHAACDVLGLDSFNEDSLYENLDWLCTNQQRIEQRLFKRRFPTQPPQLFLYDVTSSYLEGMHNALAEFGYNRDGKKGKKQIVIGLLCDEHGAPLSIEVFKGNTSDVMTMPNQIQKVAKRFAATEVTFVGDRGMIRGSVFENLKDHEGYHYITALTKKQIETLLKQHFIQMSMFDENIVEVIDSEEKVRFILRRNPVRAQEMRDTRNEKRCTILRLINRHNLFLQKHPRARAATALKWVEKKISRLKLDAWLTVEVNDQRQLYLTVAEDALAEDAKLDGCYVLKTDLKENAASAQTIHARYKDLSLVERAFRTSKTTFLEIRPVNVRKEARTRGHTFVVMLAYMIVRELTRLWSSLDMKAEEGINELSSLCLTEILDNGVVVCNTVPQPRNSVKQLLDLANVSIPQVLPTRGVVVATRKKLPENRK